MHLCVVPAMQLIIAEAEGIYMLELLNICGTQL